MIDFSKNPFFLDEKGIEWVKSTFSSMSEDDKLRQLFCLITYTDDEEYCKYIGEQVRPGGFMSRTMTAEQCISATEKMQKYSKIPMLVAANFEAGGNGMIIGGTVLGRPMEVAATQELEQARRLGEVCGVEGASVGANWSFAPIIDIDYNWRNPITNTRTFGSDPVLVKEMGKAYVEEIQKHGLAACIKHFPGDGRDERDQHVAPSINDLSCEEWDKTYGEAYKASINAGVKTVMIGHIMQPAYTRYFNKDIKDSEIMPATVNKYLVTDLLRNKLGFNGLIITDSTTMAGIAAMLPREEMVPLTIAAGCDMFLFTKSLEEDMEYMRKGYEKGVFSPERLDEAVLRILALKASLKLHEKKENGTLVPKLEDAKKIIGNDKFIAWSKECADKAITLVKEEKGVLPITPEKYKRILFYPLENKSEGATIFNVDNSQNAKFCEALKKEGFLVDVFQPAKGFEGMMTPVSEITEKYDLIIYSASLQTKSNQTVVRIEWANPMGANVPIYCHTVPTVFVSLENPYHLVDVPQVRTFINCYCGFDTVIEALVEKLTGKSEFKGTSPIDPFLNKWETRI
jgi:beta-N-acetylhexosaminidase